MHIRTYWAAKINWLREIIIKPHKSKGPQNWADKFLIYNSTVWPIISYDQKSIAKNYWIFDQQQWQLAKKTIDHAVMLKNLPSPWSHSVTLVYCIVLYYDMVITFTFSFKAKWKVNLNLKEPVFRRYRLAVLRSSALLCNDGSTKWKWLEYIWKQSQSPYEVK